MSVPLMHRPDVLHPILWGLPTRQTTAIHRVKGSLTTTTSVLIPRGAWEYNMTHQLRSSVVRGCPNTTSNRFAGIFPYQHQEDGQWIFHLIICCNMLQFKIEQPWLRGWCRTGPGNFQILKKRCPWLFKCDLIIFYSMIFPWCSRYFHDYQSLFMFFSMLILFFVATLPAYGVDHPVDHVSHEEIRWLIGNPIETYY